MEVSLKLAVILRYLSTGETYTAIPMESWKNDHLQICPQVCKAILKEFQHEYLMCPTDPEDWKKIEERFRKRWNVPHAVSVLDGKLIAIKKPKN